MRTFIISAKLWLWGENTKFLLYKQNFLSFTVAFIAAIIIARHRAKSLQNKNISSDWNASIPRRRARFAWCLVISAAFLYPIIVFDEALALKWIWDTPEIVHDKHSRTNLILFLTFWKFKLRSENIFCRHRVGEKIFLTSLRDWIS